DDRDPAALVQVRVRVFVRRRAVGGPAGVADAQLAGGGEGLEEPREALVNFPLLLARLKVAAVEHAHTRAVVTPVLQPPQPFEEDGRRLQFSDVAYDAAHKHLCKYKCRTGVACHLRTVGSAGYKKDTTIRKNGFPMTNGARMSADTSNVLSIIMGGGQGTRLFPLTRDRAKPAVPLAGKYRLVDIPISNCINSGLRRVYLLTQFNSASLHRHISQSYKFDHFAGGFVEILAAEQTFADP